MSSHAAEAAYRMPAGAQTRSSLAAAIHRGMAMAMLARRAIWLTALGRIAPRTAPTAALSSVEVALIARVLLSNRRPSTLAEALDGLAMIGAPSSSSLERPFAIARGLSKLADIQIAQRLRAAKYTSRP